MKLSFGKNFFFALALVLILLVSNNASAVMEPYLNFDTGNYFYNADTRLLSFTDVASGWIQYTDGSFSFDPAEDPIIGATLSFGPLMNSASNSLVFSSASFSIDGFITATVTDFVVSDSQLSWGTLNNIQRLDGGSSRYVTELLANGGGSGNLYIAFTPTAGGVETFSSTSSGSVTAMVAAPEPVSAILFVTGGATLGFRRFFRKKV